MWRKDAVTHSRVDTRKQSLQVARPDRPAALKRQSADHMGKKAICIALHAKSKAKG